MSQCVVLLAKETLLSKCPSLSRCIKLVVVIKCSSGVGWGVRPSDGLASHPGREKKIINIPAFLVLWNKPEGSPDLKADLALTGF